MRSYLPLVILFLAAAPSQAALLLYDGFDYTAGEKLAPRNDTVGTPNPGQHNVEYNVDWRYAGGGAATNEAPGIASGSLPAPQGLSASTGNSVAHDMTMIGTARIQVTDTPISTGTVYWSGLLRVNDVGNMTANANGILLGGFNNTVGPGGQPNAVGAGLRIRNAAAGNDHYFIGVGMNSGTAAGNTAFDNATQRLEGDTIFVVGAYEFVAGANNDRAYMWINPPASTFRAAVAPPPSLTAAPGGAVADSFPNLSTFNLRNVNTVGTTPNVQFDELRVGTDWASVTIPEPTMLALLVLAMSGLSCVVRRR